MNNQQRPSNKSTALSIGKAVSKNRKALDALIAADSRRRDTFVRERAELERLASADDARLRRNERELRRATETRVAGRLGRMVLATLRRQGLSGNLLTADDLRSLSQRDRDELNVLMSPYDGGELKEVSATPIGAQPSKVDLELDD